MVKHNGAGGGGASFSADEDSYYQVLASRLDPAAYQMIGNWPWTTDRDLYVQGAWNVAIGGQVAKRLDIREHPAATDLGLPIKSGTTLGQNQGDGGRAMLLVVDPSAVTYTNAREKFYERMMRLATLDVKEINHTLSSNTTDYLKFKSGKSFYGGRPPMLDAGNRQKQTLTRDITEGAFQTMRHGGYGHSLPQSGNTFNVRLWLGRETGYSGDILVRFERQSGLSPEGTAFSNYVTVPEESLPAIGAGPQPVDLQITLTSNFDTYSGLRVTTEAGTGNCVDWYGCYGVRSSTQTNVNAKYYDGAVWQEAAFECFAFSMWEDGVDLAPDAGLMLTSGMCYNGAWINLYGHCQTNGLAVFHEISDADPFRHGNVFYRPHIFEWGDMMGLLRNNTTLPARGQLTYVELPNDW